MFVPCTLRPLCNGPGATAREVRRIADAPVSLVQGPPGSFIAERLASTIESWGRWPGCIWLRPQDTSPTHLAKDLETAVRLRLSDGVQPDGRPGANRIPAGDGTALTAVLSSMPPGGIIVIEFPYGAPRRLRAFTEAVREPLTAHEICLVLVTQSRLGAGLRTRSRGVVPAVRLQDPLDLERIASLPGRHHDRLTALARRRPAILRDLLDAADAWTGDAVRTALDGPLDRPRLLDRLCRVLVDRCDADQLAALDMCLATGYWHPSLLPGGVPAGPLRPWVVPLEEHWGWLRPIWERPLRRCLHGRRPPSGTRCWWRGSGTPSPPSGPDPDLRLGSGPGPALGRRARTDGAEHGDAHRPDGVIQARLTGPFTLTINHTPVTGWRGRRGVGVLQYLLARHRHVCRRDELLREFWPDVPMDVARNRLQVAVSGLRRTLLEATGMQVIEYLDGCYRINPQFRVDLDVTCFERYLRAAAAADRAHDPEAAITAYHQALGHYHGDFVADAPDEEWTQLPRESYRMMMLDALSRLSRLELGCGRIDECIATARRMVDADPCCEDAHRLLMECYVRQGRVYRALRQYDFCCHVLRTRLEASPSPRTVRLVHAIRAGSPRDPALIED